MTSPVVNNNPGTTKEEKGILHVINDIPFFGKKVDMQDFAKQCGHLVQIRTVLPNNTSRNAFVSAPSWEELYSKLVRRCSTPILPHIFEIIQYDTPCKPYLDIECEWNSLPSYLETTDKIIDATEKIVKQVFVDRYGIKEDRLTSESFIWLYSPNPEKVSLHLIINSKEPVVAFVNNHDVRRGAKDLAIQIHNIDPEGLGKLVDRSVYDKDRSMRMMGCYKVGKDHSTRFIPARETSSKQYFFNSIISCSEIPGDQLEFISVPSPMKDALKNVEKTKIEINPSQPILRKENTDSNELNTQKSDVRGLLSNHKDETSNDEITRLLTLLSKTRWDNRSDWMKIAIALKHEYGDKYFELWKRMSRCSRKFVEQECDRLWNSLCTTTESKEEKLLTMRTVHQWAQHDDPIGYQEFRSSTMKPPVFMMQKLREDATGLADIAVEALKNRVKKVGENDIFYFVQDEKVWKRGTEKNIWRSVVNSVVDAVHEVEMYHTAVYNARKDKMSEEDLEFETNKLEKLKHELRKIMKYIRGYNGQRSVTAIASPNFEDPFFEEKLDNIPYLLGVRNGVVDLRTGRLRERKEADNLFRILDVDYLPDADSSLLEETVRQIMAEDDEMIEFLHKLFGYAITGDVSEEIFVIFTAGGRNGKGVLMQATEYVMGPFFKNMNKGLIVEHRMANGDAERGQLKGSRIAAFNEIEGGQRLLSSEVQLLSGGDSIPVKELYKNPTCITPRHLCILCTNHMPEVNEVKPSLMQRLLCVPFPVHFKDLRENEQPSLFVRQCQNNLKQKLKANPEGILKWLVNGAVKWYASQNLKMTAPQKVRAFSQKYFEEQDKVTAYIQHHCEVDPEFHVSTSVFLNALNEWLQHDENCPKFNSKRLASAMAHKGFEKKQHAFYSNGIRRNEMSFIGLRLKESFDIDSDDD